MKVYVDELPKKCEDCVFSEIGFVWDSEVRFCKLKPRCMNWISLYVKKRKDCTLCSLTDYTKQVRKEVCEEIGKQLVLIIDGKRQVFSDVSMTGDKTIMAVLDQIQGEIK